jgi:hypothetical protein
MIDKTTSWSPEQQKILDCSSWTLQDRQDLMEVYSPEEYMKSLEAYKSLERDKLIADVYARYKLMSDVRIIKVCKFHDQVEERRRRRRFPTPWEKDL